MKKTLKSLLAGVLAVLLLVAAVPMNISVEANAQENEYVIRDDETITIEIEAGNFTAVKVVPECGGVYDVVIYSESGGVGSDLSLSVDGFSGKHIKIFIDGVPQEGVGAAFSLNNIPAGYADRIEVYRGVVPVGFGADALGGVVNIVTNKLKMVLGTHKNITKT